MSAACRTFFTGAIVGASLAAAAISGPGAVAFSRMQATAAAQRAQAATKSSSKVVLENDRVRVKDVTFAPGITDTGMHTHQLPHVGVILTAGALTFTEPGKPSETVKFASGAVGYREANATHQVTNPGKTPMRVIEVELK